MSRKLCVLLGAILLANAAMAQFTLGIKAGANLTKIDGKSFKDEFETGYHVGGFAEIGLGGKLGIQPEVLFNQYQTKVDTSFSDVYRDPFSKDIKLNYLSIPLLLTYKLGNNLSLMAGPQYGILLDQEKNLLENGKDAFKNGDFSVLGGAQLKISKLRLSGRYVVGLSDISNVPQEIGDQSKWKNQGWQLSVGLAL